VSHRRGFCSFEASGRVSEVPADTEVFMPAPTPLHVMSSAKWTGRHHAHLLCMPCPRWMECVRRHGASIRGMHCAVLILMLSALWKKAAQ
jgi:hypothetical protein